jgi:hypothetical protein
MLAYRHEGFWHRMDTLRDKQFLELLWASSKAPWALAWNIAFVALRLFNVFGIHEVSQRLIPNLIRLPENDTPVELTPREQGRDLLFEDDVVNALLQASGYDCTRFTMFVPRARFASEKWARLWRTAVNKPRELLQ